MTSKWTSDAMIRDVINERKISSRSSFRYTNETIKTNSQTYDVTLITQTSVERLFFLKYISDRWHGPLSVAIFFPEDLENKDVIKSNMLQLKRIHYEFFIPTLKEYPYNKLRNIAIRNVQTTHYYVSDMDLWPANNLYESLIGLPDTFLQDDWLALIIPSFEYKIKSPCKDFEWCVNKVSNAIPKNKEELRKCLLAKDCNTFRKGQGVHDYHFNRWMYRPETTSVTMVSCFQTDRQEPYVMVKRSMHLPEFSEAFVNYGRDKISWIENLRYIGYKFGTLTQSFATDIPHPKSNWFKEWANTLTNQGRDAVPAEVTYKKFIEYLHMDPDRSVVHYCDKENK